MTRILRNRSCWLAISGLVVAAAGRALANEPLFWLGYAVTLAAVVAWLWRGYHRLGTGRHSALSVVFADDENDDEAPLHISATPADGISDIGGLVEQMLARGRYALLLRPQIARGLSPELLLKAHQAMSNGMALVPDGEVLLEPNDPAYDTGVSPTEAADRAPSAVIQVQSLFLDRYTVTNRQYQAFVDDGGYEQMAIWDPEIWPAVLDFVDQTGTPGPRFWKNGRFIKNEGNYPVVGVSWYEACAFARWVGKRLPTDAEWVKAGCWPVTLSATTRLQRKYPWGDAIDHSRANLWATGVGRTQPVNESAEGVSVGGVFQLIGNVWEWTTDDFRYDLPAANAGPDGPLLKTIRGGAFDTYFDNQATCQFASGENPAARKHNIGFRCAVGVCDLAEVEPRDEQPIGQAFEPDAVEPHGWELETTAYQAGKPERHEEVTV